MKVKIIHTKKYPIRLYLTEAEVANLIAIIKHAPSTIIEPSASDPYYKIQSRAEKLKFFQHIDRHAQASYDAFPLVFKEKKLI